MILTLYVLTVALAAGATHTWAVRETSIPYAALAAGGLSTYERWAKWVNENRGERLIAERSSGRLCDQSIMQCYREAGKAPQDADARPLESDRKRAFRAAHDAATSYQTLSIETEGLRALTDATTVHKREESSSSKSLKERAAEGLD